MKKKLKIPNSSRPQLKAAPVFRIGLLIMLLCVSGSIFAAQDKKVKEDKAKSVETTRETLEKWVETRQIISKEKKDLAMARDTLNGQIELLDREIDTLDKKTAETNKNISELDKKKADMVKENDKLKKASSTLAGIVDTLEARTRKLLKRLPEPIRERVKPLSQRIPQKGKESKLSVSERFQNVIGILNEINKFNGEITVTSEVRKLDDGTSVEVTALYIGIGQGYYVNASGTIAGVGRATDDGWQWTQANDAASAISNAIAMLKNEQVAAFVKLPIEIK